MPERLRVSQSLGSSPPNTRQTVSLTMYVSGLGYSWVGFRMSLRAWSPNSHSQTTTAPSEVSVNSTNTPSPSTV